MLPCEHWPFYAGADSLRVYVAKHTADVHARAAGAGRQSSTLSFCRLGAVHLARRRPNDGHGN